MRYAPIEDHGVIGDLHTVALVSTDGTIDWYCPERFDAPSVFASILDADHGGRFRIAPEDNSRWRNHTCRRRLTCLKKAKPPTQIFSPITSIIWEGSTRCSKT